jgi:hypothetical protein
VAAEVDPVEEPEVLQKEKYNREQEDLPQQEYVVKELDLLERPVPFVVLREG